jgi:CHAT domain-containing protein
MDNNNSKLISSRLQRHGAELRCGLMTSVLVAVLLVSMVMSASAAPAAAGMQEARTDVLAGDMMANTLAVQQLTLLSGDSVQVSVPAHARYLLVQNIGIDTVARLLDQRQQVISETTSWRGREGLYVLEIPADQASAQVEMVSGKLHVANGQIKLIWLDEQELSQQAVQALSHYSRAASLHLEAYGGAASQRSAAIAAYQQALRLASGSELQTLVADLHYEIGQAQRNAGDLELAQASYRQALAAYQANADHSGIAVTYNALGRIASHQGKLDEAVSLYHRSLAERQRLNDSDYPHNALYQAITLNNIAVLQLERDHFDAAIIAFQQALPMLAGVPNQSVDTVFAMSSAQIGENGDLSETVNTMNNLAAAKAAVGQVGEAAELYERTMLLATETNQPKRVADAHFNIGRLLLDLGQLDAALRHLDSAAVMFADLQNDFWYGQTLEWIANIYTAVGEHAAAEDYLTRALALSGENQRQRANVLSRLGNVDYQQDELASADYYYAQSYDSFASSGQPGSAAVVASEHALVDMAQGETDVALRKQRQAMAVLERLGQPREAARARARLGQSLLESGDREAADRELSVALAGHRAVGDQLFELDTLVALSDARNGQAALDTIKQAATLASSIRLHTRAPQLQTSFSASRRNAFAKYIDLLTAAGRTAEAWAVSEHVRARSLMDLIDADLQITSDSAIRERRDHLLEALASSKSSLPKQQLRRQLDLLESRIRDNISIAEMNEFRPDAKALQTKLADDILMISYFLGDQHSHLWLVTDKTLEHYQLPSGAAITDTVHALSDALRSQRQSPARIQYTAQLLRDQILPLDDAVLSNRDLVIVADGSLQSVPFGLLPLAENQLLMDHSTIMYSPSARLFTMLDNKFSISPTSIAVLADPLSDNTSMLVMNDQPGIGASQLFAQRALHQSAINVDRLPGARNEALAIQNSVAAAGDLEPIRRINVKMGSDASHDFVMNGGLQGYGIVHFATHGVVDADVPELSGLVLADASQSNQSMSYLRPHEIANLQLDADLVVLSGCETGIGKSLAGEGLMSLSRPFFVAGARQVISSLWKVSDQATAALMQHFYGHMLNDKESAEVALRKAKEDMRADPQWQHPYFWAGFVIQGGRAELAVQHSSGYAQLAQSPVWDQSAFAAVLMGTTSP